MPQLDGGRGALGVDGVGEAPQPGHDLGAHPQLVAERPAVLADGAVGEGGHADAAGGHAPVVLDEPVGDHAALGETLETARPHHAVAQRQTREGEWRENCTRIRVRCFHHHGPPVGSRVFGTISQGGGAPGKPRMAQLRQDREALLAEVVVGRDGLSDVEPSHDDKARAVRERILLVWPIRE